MKKPPLIAKIKPALGEHVRFTSEVSKIRNRAALTKAHEESIVRINEIMQIARDNPWGVGESRLDYARRQMEELLRELRHNEALAPAAIIPEVVVA